jgi:hypothetical protein
LTIDHAINELGFDLGQCLPRFVRRSVAEPHHTNSSDAGQRMCMSKASVGNTAADHLILEDN